MKNCPTLGLMYCKLKCGRFGTNFSVAAKCNCDINLLRHKSSVLLLFLVILCSRFIMGASNVLGDECDWFGSGLSYHDDPGRGVTPVYLRCSQGHLEWVYPKGALRVLLRLGASGRNFRGCIKVGDNFKGARIFLEGPRSLVPLFSPEDGSSPRLVRCFQSRGAQAALYIEAFHNSDFTRNVASLTYDLEPLPRGGKYYDPTEECRPCTEDEMAHAYCTSDIVSRGIIRSTEIKEELELTTMTVKITKFLRHSTEDNNFNVNEGKISENDIISNNDQLNTLDINVSRHCDVKHGAGEFVFMARRKLGDLRLSCAPRIEDWAQIVQRINKSGSAHCILKS